MLESLTIARALGNVSTPIKQRDDLSGIRGMILWERRSDGPLDYLAPNHHTLSVYQGGGNGTWSCESRAWGFSEAVCLLPEGYDARWKHNGYVKNLHLYFTAEDLEAMNWTDSGDPAPLIFGRHPLLNTLSAALANDLDWAEPADRLAVDHLVLAMMSQMSRAETSLARVLSPAALKRIEARMHALEDGVPSLAALAGQVGMSPRHLTRLFKAATYRTLSDRQRQIQVETAKTLLRGSEPLSSVAIACGFGSQSHFTRIFRSETGITPAIWRKAQN